MTSEGTTAGVGKGSAVTLGGMAGRDVAGGGTEPSTGGNHFARRCCRDTGAAGASGTDGMTGSGAFIGGAGASTGEGLLDAQPIRDRWGNCFWGTLTRAGPLAAQASRATGK